MRLLAFGIWHSLSAALFAPIFALLPDLWPPSNHPALLILFRRCSWRTRIAFGFRRLRKLAIPQHLPWASLFYEFNVSVCVCVRWFCDFCFCPFFRTVASFPRKTAAKKHVSSLTRPFHRVRFPPAHHTPVRPPRIFQHFLSIFPNASSTFPFSWSLWPPALFDFYACGFSFDFAVRDCCSCVKAFSQTGQIGETPWRWWRWRDDDDVVCFRWRNCGNRGVIALCNVPRMQFFCQTLLDSP